MVRTNLNQSKEEYKKKLLFGNLLSSERRVNDTADLVKKICGYDSVPTRPGKQQDVDEFSNFS